MEISQEDALELYHALGDLVSLKYEKEREGKTEFYRNAAPVAWQRAKEIINKINIEQERLKFLYQNII